MLKKYGVQIKLVLVFIVDETLVQLAVYDFFISSCRLKLLHLIYRNGIKWSILVLPGMYCYQHCIPNKSFIFIGLASSLTTFEPGLGGTHEQLRSSVGEKKSGSNFLAIL